MIKSLKRKKPVISTPEEGERIYLSGRSVKHIQNTFLLGEYKATEIQSGYSKKHNSELMLAAAIAADECKHHKITPTQSGVVRGFIEKIHSMLPEELHDEGSKRESLLEDMHNMLLKNQQSLQTSGFSVKPISHDRETLKAELKAELLNDIMGER